MSQSNNHSTTVETAVITNGRRNSRAYTAGAQALDFLTFLLFIMILVISISVVPIVTRLLIYVQPAFPKFNVESSSLSILNVSSIGISANWVVTFSAENPNNKNIFYDEIKASVLDDKKAVLSNTTAPAFTLSGKAQSKIETNFTRMLMRVMNCITKNNTLGGEHCGAVNLNVELAARAKYGGWTWPTRRDTVRVSCEDVQVKFKFPSNISKTVELGPSKCDASGNWKGLANKCYTFFWNYVYVVSICFFILCLVI
ncbi:hypothetical protein K2173_021070 [Erythroxylum novogranatense]|uniref:Uncharacterized protein n=1 Tax=Erythroxylum novogranatense TaxID=1862640 RepID=A0AAV8TMH8_9ROSI|nr:hypothetical protein K2173_021070 [Erythroxylum novogranatense]